MTNERSDLFLLADCRTVLKRAEGALKGVLDVVESGEARDILRSIDTVVARIDKRPAVEPNPTPEDLGGCSIACGKCGREAVLRYTDRTKTHVEIASVTGWTYSSVGGCRCPSCGTKGTARIEVTRWQQYPHAASKAGDVCTTCGEKWLQSPDGTGIWHSCHT